MFPIRDHNPSETPPYVTYALIAINVVVFLGYWPFMADRELHYFFFEWALLPENITDGRSLHTLVSSMFLHGGYLHLGFNMLFLWVFGDNLEEEFGHFRYLLFYLASGIGAGLAHVLVSPDSTQPLVGASGAIAGVMGGYLLLYPKAKVDVLFIFIVFFRIWPIPAWIMLGIWFAMQLLNGVAASADSGIAYWAHAGGFVVGLVLTIPAWLKRGGKSYWARTQGHPEHPEARYNLQSSRIPIIRRRK